MKQKQKMKYIPPVVCAIVLELEQGIATGSTTAQPGDSSGNSSQPDVTDWNAGGTTDQSFEL